LLNSFIPLRGVWGCGDSERKTGGMEKEKECSPVFVMGRTFGRKKGARKEYKSELEEGGECN